MIEFIEGSQEELEKYGIVEQQTRAFINDVIYINFMSKIVNAILKLILF
jgi:hypothetical protein